MVKKIIIVLTVSLFSLGLFAQDKYMKDIDETQFFSKKIAELFKENEMSNLFKELSPYWPLPQNEIDALEEKTTKYINILGERFGESIGIVKVKNEKIADIATRETYIIRYEYTAIRVVITYYKNDKGWLVNAFKWDDSFTKEFE